MTTEDYVSFETSKLLKEKGFESDECIAIYDLGDNNAFVRDSSIFDNGPEDYLEYQWGEEWRRFGYYLAPTLQMAMKWLRENHKIQIVVSPYNTLNKTWSYHMFKNFEPLTQRFYVFETYEKACEEAIKFCLENLI